jgi:hypothetical protein
LTFIAGLLFAFAATLFVFALDADCWHALAKMESASVAERSKSVDGFKAKMRMKRLSLRVRRRCKGKPPRFMLALLKGTA